MITTRIATGLLGLDVFTFNGQRERMTIEEFSKFIDYAFANSISYVAVDVETGQKYDEALFCL